MRGTGRVGRPVRVIVLSREAYSSSVRRQRRLDRLTTAGDSDEPLCAPLYGWRSGYLMGAPCAQALDRKEDYETGKTVCDLRWDVRQPVARPAGLTLRFLRHEGSVPVARSRSPRSMVRSTRKPVGSVAGSVRSSASVSGR